jgi:DNA-binding NarL/FixJ family response regulator
MLASVPTGEIASLPTDYFGSRVGLAVLDVWMPARGGIEVQERLYHLSPQTRVIFITARREPATRALALDAGAFAFLSKPLDDEAFLAAVHSALGR